MTRMAVLDWRRNRDMWVELLQRQTGKGVEEWNRRIRRAKHGDELALRKWLAERGVTGYAQSLLVMERFGYPDFVLATAGELIDRQYADRPKLRPIYTALIKLARTLGKVTVQARKGYVSLVAPRRTFARIQATTKNRVDLGLRLEGQKPEGRLRPSTLHETMRVQIGLGKTQDVDKEVLSFLRRAYEENS
jgi:hypothetical protein